MGLGIPSGICYKFQRSGKCTRRDCRYKHIYPEASYPNYSFKNSLDGVEGYQGRKNGVCNEFERTGACTRSNCKYMHCSYRFRKERSFSNHRQVPNKTAFNLRPTQNRRDRTGQRRLNICYKYRDEGIAHLVQDVNLIILISLSLINTHLIMKVSQSIFF